MQKLDKTFKINPLYETDMYKIAHKAMLAPGTTRLYGTWIPRKLNYMPRGINKILSAGQQLVVRWIHSNFQENFFVQPIEVAEKFVSDMSLALGMPFDGQHFIKLHELGYLPIKIKSLPEGIETNPNIPHMTFINTVDDYGWLTLFLETYLSKLAWRLPTAATISKRYREIVTEWVTKTDPDNLWLVDYLCHDFHARGGSPFDSIVVGLAHCLLFRGSDTLSAIEAARYFYDEPENVVCLNSVTASEHSVSTTKIFTVGEQQMLSDWMKIFPSGILSVVSDTFDLFKLITEYLPALKDEIMSRDGKLVIRPDSGNPVDIICGFPESKDMGEVHSRGYLTNNMYDFYDYAGVEKDKYYIIPAEEAEPIEISLAEKKGVIELLWDIFGGTVNEQGYKVLDSHIGAIYGDSINLERQLEIYQRLEAKGFAASNIVLGIGSYQYIGSITRDSAGYAAKGAWFEILDEEMLLKIEDNMEGLVTDKQYDSCKTGYNIYKDPSTDDGTKKSLKGLQMVYKDDDGEYQVKSECTFEEENEGYLQVIYEDGVFHNQTTLQEIRERINNNE